MPDRGKILHELDHQVADADWCERKYKDCDGTCEIAAYVVNAPTIGGWISVKKKLPEEHESIFHKYLGTPLWSNAMWKQESDKVLVCVSFPDGTSVVTTGCLQDSGWVTTVSKVIPQTVTHWMPLPAPPKEEEE